MFLVRFALCCCALLLTGCALGPVQTPATDVEVPALSGALYGGQQPVSGATITLLVAGTSGYGTGATTLVSATSNGAGGFTLPAHTCPYANAPVYVTARAGNAGSGTNANIMMAAGLGPCSGLSSSTFININEVTTAATAYALSHFFTTTLGSGSTDGFGGTAAGSGTYNQGLIVANQATIPTLVSISSGLAQTTTTAGSMTTTLESAKLNSIADVLASCVNSSGETSVSETTTNCGKLFAATLPPGASTRPYDTLQAAVQMALYPYQNLTALFNLSTGSPPFVGLSGVPNDWTLGVSYSSTVFGLGINGSSTAHSGSSLDVDLAGDVWFPTNTSTSHGIVEFSPFTGSFSGPYATALVHPQYVAISQDGRVWSSDMAAAQIVSTSTTSPSASGTSSATTGFTGPIQGAYSGSTTGAVVYMGGGTSSSLGSTLYQNVSGAVSALLSFSGVPNNIVSYGSGVLDVDAATSSASSCRYESDTTGSLSTQSSASASPCFAGGVANDGSGQDGVITLASTNQLCNYGYGGTGTCFTSPVALSTPQAIQSDGDNHLWIANSGNSSVSTLVDVPASNGSTWTAADYQRTSTVPYLHNVSNGNTLTTPYGLAIDRSGNVWVSNAGCVSTNGTACTPGAFVLSELIGAAAPTITPLALVEINNGANARPSVSDAAPVRAEAGVVQPAARQGRGNARPH